MVDLGRCGFFALDVIFMKSPDVPDEANQTFQSYLHWMQ